MFTSIAGRSVIVTGASKGIGKGIARVFARQGRQRAGGRAGSGGGARRHADEIKAAGGTAAAFSADVRKSEDMERMAEAAEKAHGGIDILCANAGIFPAAKLTEMTAEKWDEVLGTNLKGTFLAVKACLPAMKKKKQGPHHHHLLHHRADHRLSRLDRITAPARPASSASCAPPAIELAPQQHHHQRGDARQYQDRGPGRAGRRST